MKKTILPMFVVATMLLTGCSNNNESDMHARTEGDIWEATDVQPASKSDPAFAVGYNNISTNSNGGNFYVTVNYGDYGHVEYDIQYDNNAGYTGTYVYCYISGDATLDEFLQEVDVPIDELDMTFISSGIYFGFTEDNGLDGFDKSLTQTEQYDVFCDKYNYTQDKTLSTDDYLLAEPEVYTLKVGKSTSVSVTHVPTDYSGTYKYDTSDPLTVTIDEHGVASALKEGTVTVTVSTETGSYSCQFVITVV